MPSILSLFLIESRKQMQLSFLWNTLNFVGHNGNTCVCFLPQLLGKSSNTHSFSPWSCTQRLQSSYRCIWIRLIKSTRHDNWKNTNWWANIWSIAYNKSIMGALINRAINQSKPKLVCSSWLFLIILLNPCSCFDKLFQCVGCWPRYLIKMFSSYSGLCIMHLATHSSRV